MVSYSELMQQVGSSACRAGRIHVKNNTHATFRMHMKFQFEEKSPIQSDKDADAAHQPINSAGGLYSDCFAETHQNLT